VFHSTIKSQLKAKRYQMKKLKMDGHEKPHHIREDHWLNLAKLITDKRKMQEAEKLKLSRQQVKNMISARRSEGQVKTNLVRNTMMSSF
jgi:hypothetical protein